MRDPHKVVDGACVRLIKGVRIGGRRKEVGQIDLLEAWLRGQRLIQWIFYRRVHRNISIGTR